MEVKYFLERRTKFIRDFYDRSVAPFLEIVRKIDNDEEPFKTPSDYGYDEEGNYVGIGEPAFSTEWQEAQDAIQIQGRSCLSMLAASLNMYFTTWAHQLGVKPPKKKNGEGWLQAYQRVLGERAGILWDSCPVNRALIEQIVLARNRDQHPDNITAFYSHHSEDDMRKHPQMFFVSESETEMLRGFDGGDAAENEAFRWLITPTVSVDREKLLTAIDEVEKLCNWLEEQFFEAKYPGSTARRAAHGS
ncbi:hypothetical protein LBW60_01495 [Ralstonia solanacearum]|uniref:hypothetical protein n=1 Tax=Ralstonia solanacearum TaxID=305 RepID=UPI001FFBEC9C|nr:hypothetical protein [Ralstonia solanacearum]MDB0507743.1 hypothetical protein [Ralstonia solanacearum]MDB0512013.1 hypothetical protein [Ralstonia solanacearum]MDB0529330.1 hypothetical protein [Ralstonia solanacearum]